ncbi:PDZ domain-containing protein 8 [Orchesella cincta]|uniref:PDZ domain-containing protein 8 n=1 Tax=Orchesella cincta TaxID=48709 RepID=A0A1D2M966_ORCCI|nr:PDZ domain-containing protein 8 [Orchesella cincta]
MSSKTVQPPCDISTPPPCTTRQPCIPSFRKENCTTETFPCRISRRNQTICPPPRTVCQPEFKCPPPDVDCPKPDIVCTQPQVVCSPPIVNCPGLVTTCQPLRGM